MVYPPPPWTLQGYAYQSLHLINIQKVRSLIPAELDIVSVAPAHTLGGIYWSKYGSGSVLPYHELIVVAGLVRYQHQVGAWISHIYVDNLDSVAGGREIWGLPKEWADFSWDTKQIRVQQGDRLLCILNLEWQIPLWKQTLLGQAFGLLNHNFLLIPCQAETHLAIINAQLTVSPASPFAGLNLENPWLLLSCQSLNLKVDAPKIIGQRTPNMVFSDSSS